MSRHKHGLHNSRIYHIWENMKQRCTNSNHNAFIHYGGSGITICKEWNNFLPFFDWAISNGYKKTLTLDRKDGTKNYEPSNCRWTTKTVQSRNTKLLRKDSPTAFRGVGLNRSGKKYVSQIQLNGKKKHLGTFDYSYTAAYAYDSFVITNKLEHTRNFNGF